MANDHQKRGTYYLGASQTVEEPFPICYAALLIEPPAYC